MLVDFDLFSNLSSMSILELFELNQNYEILNLSTTETKLQIQKIAFHRWEKR